jgi:hypothetical protein
MLKNRQGAISHFLVDLDTFQLGLQKHDIVHAVNDSEVASFELEKSRICECDCARYYSLIILDAEMDNAKAEIEELKVNLDEEERLRRNRKEYDVLAAKINSLPSRHTSIR